MRRAKVWGQPMDLASIHLASTARSLGNGDDNGDGDDDDDDDDVDEDDNGDNGRLLFGRPAAASSFSSRSCLKSSGELAVGSCVARAVQ